MKEYEMIKSKEEGKMLIKSDTNIDLITLVTTNRKQIERTNLDPWDFL